MTEREGEAVAAATRTLLRALGEDPEREGLAGTPRRVVQAWEEMTSGYATDPLAVLKTFASDADQMVLVRGIEFWSTCEHHLLPFHGRCTIGYVPNGKIVGLSKLPRLVNIFARRLQVQERLTAEIARALEGGIAAQGVGVIVEATHLCMAARGIRSPARMVTSCLLGVMRDDSTRAEFLRLSGVRP